MQMVSIYCIIMPLIFSRVRSSFTQRQNVFPSRRVARTISESPCDDVSSSFPSWSYESRPFFKFEIIHESTKSGARVGRIHTPHGVVDTPAFVAVATNGALKGVDFRDADDAGQQLIFCNTYHLLLQPGPDIIRDAGGLHSFTNRNGGPFITDSGGFQVFSLAYGSVHDELKSKGELKRASAKKGDRPNPVTVTEKGVTFRSYRDGAKILLTPESTVEAQKKIQSDIILPLDELPPYHIDRDLLVKSVERSHRWEARSLTEHLKNVNDQAMYGIVHGGLDKELRKSSVDFVTSLPFDGYAIGGSLGNGRDELKGLLDWLMPMFYDEKDRTKPRHLLGIADEESVRYAAGLGVDSMDSSYPTKLGRHGSLLSKNGIVHIRRSKHAKQYGVKIDEECTCKTCAQYDRAYLCHLFKASEPLAIQLGALHNIHYMNQLMSEIRNDIMENKI